MSLKRIIQRGIENAPQVGCSGVLYPWMFVASRDEWEKKLKSSTESGWEDREFFGICDAPNNMYFPHVINKGRYVYLYRVDSHGDLDSRAFTHAVIAEGGKQLRRCAV